MAILNQLTYIYLYGGSVEGQAKNIQPKGDKKPLIDTKNTLPLWKVYSKFWYL